MEYAAAWQLYKIAFSQIEILERYDRTFNHLFDILGTTEEVYIQWKREGRQ